MAAALPKCVVLCLTDSEDAFYYATSLERHKYHALKPMIRAASELERESDQAFAEACERALASSSSSPSPLASTDGELKGGDIDDRGHEDHAQMQPTSTQERSDREVEAVRRLFSVPAVPTPTSTCTQSVRMCPGASYVAPSQLPFLYCASQQNIVANIAFFASLFTDERRAICAEQRAMVSNGPNLAPLTRVTLC